MKARPVTPLLHGLIQQALLALLVLGAPGALAQEPPPPESPAAEEASGAWAPDRPEPGSVEKIREYTTGPEFLPESVAYVPDSETVPSPTKALGHLAGAPDELSRVADVHGYFRRLDEASDRVRVQVIGTSEEGREILLAMVSDAENLADLDRYKDIAARLADPRRTPREEARGLAAEGKVFYWLTGGLHSIETGSPEMLMELAYRLAVSERPEIQAIRRNTIVFITPVTEPDGRDRQVDWYYRHLRGKKMPWEEMAEILSPPYWGHYVLHDNNRDGMQVTQALTRAIHETFYAFHPQVMHDLHESVPLLYIMTGYGPYNRAIDPVTINEWTQLGYHEAGALSAQGLAGVWTWGFFDGWWPGYLNSVANTHHSVGRFYETFGNASAGTFDRDLSERKFVGKPVTEVQWYRPLPPPKKVRWSLRNNTNYMQAGVLAALQYASLHRQELLDNFWTKGERSLQKGRTEAPYAWVFPPAQRDPARLAYLVNQLRQHRVEVHRLTAETKLGAKTWPAGTYVVRMDQPYRNLAINLLEEQKFPPEEPNPPYDDVAWTWPLLYGAEGEQVADRKMLDAAMEPLTADVVPAGTVDGAGEVFLLRDTGQTALLEARVLLGTHQVDAAEAAFTAGGVSYPAGSWIVQAPREAVEEAARRTGLSFTAAAALPEVRRHLVDLPRLALLHNWLDTQDAGWARYTLDRGKVPYTLINDDDLKRGGLAERFDVILYPRTGGDFSELVHGIDPKYGPLAYTRTPEFPSHGIPDASEDITGGMGFEGLVNLQRFVQGGGVLVTLAGAGTLPVDGGLVRGVSRVPASGFNTPGSELRAKIVRPEHPIAYGYEELTSVFRGNGPIFDVGKLDRGRVVMQFGTKKPEGEEEEKKKGSGSGIEEEDLDEPEAKTEEKAGKEPKKDDGKLVLSGFVRGEDQVNGKPAILDVPSGRGRVILFAFNPLHRYLNLSDFRLVYNALLNWNDLP
ncbi:MAG TPA: M14 family zinc carboxypeptidase [Thermoanaerobaculia bacterium]|nr:M14 family zinc carboxypeptidase [Thermoanaerobaculia bacterium]